MPPKKKTKDARAAPNPKKDLLGQALYMVVVSGLKPDMAIKACGGEVDASALSRKISEAAKERALSDLKAEAASGRIASAGGMFRFLGNMVYNSTEMLLARRIQREDRERDEQAKEDRRIEEHNNKFLEAEKVYNKHVAGEKLQNKDLKVLLRYICPEEDGDDKNNPSQYTTAAAMKQRLERCKIPWQQYFQNNNNNGNETASELGEDAPFSHFDPDEEIPPIPPPANDEVDEPTQQAMV